MENPNFPGPCSIGHPCAVSLRAAACRATLAAIGLALVAARPLNAQGTPEVLTVGNVVRATLANNPGIRLSVTQRRAADGDLIAAGAPFASNVVASVAASHERSAESASAATAELLGGNAYRIGLSKRLRQGLLLQPAVVVTRLGSPGVAEPFATAATLTLEVPLLRNWGGGTFKAAERASMARVDAATHSVDHTTAENLHDAVVRYWGYWAAYRRLMVRDSAETRAQRMVDEMHVLVEADERPRADLDQARANLITKRVARITAQQDVLDARRQLGLVMGLAPDRILELPPPSMDLPSMDAWEPDTGMARRLVDTALTHRADLAATASLSQAAEALVTAARQDTRPQLDFVSDIAVDGLGSRTIPGSVDALVNGGRSRVSASIELRYLVSGASPQARGDLIQREASRDGVRIMYARLQREIAVGVRVAVEGVRQSSLSAAESEMAVALHRTAVGNERLKYSLGTSTLLDVLLAEDGLTGAMLDEVAAQTTYLQAIVTLRFETGTLIAGSPDGPVVHLDVPARAP